MTTGYFDDLQKPEYICIE